MKFKLPIGVCIAVSLVLVLAGIGYGTVSGYADERAHVTQLLSGADGLLSVTDYRAGDGFNLCVVAKRHLSDDADVQALEAAAKALRDEKATLTQRKAADASLTAAVAAVAQKLRQTPSFTASARDKAYLDMLLTDLEQLGANAIFTTYNNAAEGFNAELEKPFSGFIAKLLGVTPCELY